MLKRGVPPGGEAGRAAGELGSRGKEAKMREQIRLYYRNVTAEVVGRKEGLTQGELKGLGKEVRRVTKLMEVQRREGKLPYRDLPYQEALRGQVHKLARKLAGRFDNLAVLGIGGSALGNIALQTALSDPLYNLRPPRGKPRLFVMDNVDPVQFGGLLDYLEGQWERTCFNVISKSGQTAETAAQFLIVKDLLKKRLPKGRLAEHVIATTDPAKGTLREVAEREGLTCLEVPEGVGGRFSVLSQVGLFSAAMCGIDIEQLHAGARAMDRRVQRADWRKNPAALFAAIQYLFYQKGKRLSVMMPYSYQLKDLGDWYRQLWAESLGKQRDLKGKVVEVGPTPIKALGATDQHSQVQLYREGPHDKVFTFLEVAEFERDVALPKAAAEEALEYLGGKTMGKLMHCEKAATEYALLQSGRPCLTVRFPQVDAHTVGQFIYLFEAATSIMGEMLGINPYDQPAVELGKEATWALMGHAGYKSLRAKIESARRIDKKYLA